VSGEGVSRMSRAAVDGEVLRLFNLILETGVYPSLWRVAVVVPLLKGANLLASDANNYRGLALLCSLSKLFANIQEARLTTFMWSTDQVAPEQFGFTRGRRTLDPAFILDSLISQAGPGAKGKKLFVAFIDFQKAYDFVPLRVCCGNC